MCMYKTLHGLEDLCGQMETKEGPLKTVKIRERKIAALVGIRSPFSFISPPRFEVLFTPFS